MCLIIIYVILTPQVISYTFGEYSEDDINRPNPNLPYSVNHRLINLLSRQQIDTLPYHYGLSTHDGYELEGTVSPGHMMKRDGPPLSIVNPLDVLRQQLMLDMARQKMRENQNKIRQNHEYLKNLGKRSISFQKDISRSLENSRLHRSFLDKKVFQTSEV